MGKMKEVYQLKQELILKNKELYENLPDSYFINLYLEEADYYQSNVQLPQDTYDGGFIDEP